MKNLLAVAGNVTALAGVLICLIAGATRLVGSFYVLGYEAMTLFNVGVALMVTACLAKLHRLSMD